MRVKLAEIGSELPLRYAVPFVAVIYAIGFYGFYQVCPAGSACGAGSEPFTFFNNALRTFGLFFTLSEPGHEALRNVWLLTARWIAPCITLFAIFRIFADRLSVWRKQRLLGALKDHLLLVGLGHSARHLMVTTQPIVVVDRVPDVFSGAAISKTKFNIIGDGREPEVLSKARITSAKSMLIMGGSDSENLEIVSQVSKLREQSKGKLRVAVRLKSQSLAAQLNREDSFVTAKNLDVTAFTLDQLAARVFLSEISLSEIAQLRSLARVHLVIIGWSDFALSTVLQFLRISPFADLGAPRISIACENAAEILQRIQQQFPSLMDKTITLVEARQILDLPNEKQLAEFEIIDPVTAVLIADDDGEKNVVTGLALRQLTQISNQCTAPIYVRLESSGALESMLQSKFGHNTDPALEIIPVGQAEKCLSFENVFGSREELAKQFHEVYRKNNTNTSVATVPWEELPATYRAANIASTDHSKARILSAGYIIQSGNTVPHGAWNILEPSVAMEKLSEITHRSWEIDRRLDGWRYGKTRDNLKLLHPSLKPYDQLTNALQELDRAQIRLLANVLQLGDKPVTVFKDCLVACLGHNALVSGEAEKVKAATQNAIQAIAAEHVTLVSPLAPGSDCEIVDAALDVLKAQKIPHRLLVLHALPWAVVRDEFVKTHGGNSSDLVLMRSKILGKAGTAAHIVHLAPSGLSDEDWVNNAPLRISAYRQANLWMVLRAHHVLCHLHEGRKALPGGTAEAVKKFKNSKAQIHRV